MGDLFRRACCCWPPGVLARVEFTNLHNTPHPSYAPDAVGGYALHYTLTTHPLDTLGEAVPDTGRRGTADSVPTDADA